MTADRIASLVEQWLYIPDKTFKVDLNTNEYVIATFIKAYDYEELKAKNVWRIIKSAELIKWRSTGNLELSELINGALIKDITHI